MVDIQLLTRQYFYFDLPVEYNIDDKAIHVSPVTVIDSEIFLSCCSILSIKKNDIPSAEIIKMSYLQFLTDVVFPNELKAKTKLGTILSLCLGFKNPKIIYQNKKPFILNDGIKISSKQFDDIRKIILHQNILNYDDSYINPDLQKSMEEMDALKAKNIEIPTMERKIAIITSHTGIDKKQQLEMTLRSHTLLFNEVYNEVRFNAFAGISCFGKEPIEDWVYKKKRDKFEEYFVEEDKYNQSMGGDGSVKKSETTIDYNKLYENF